MKLRYAIFAAGGAGLVAVMVAGGAHMLPANPRYGDTFNRVAGPERQATDVVSAVNFDYRALDTMIEESILFASVIAVAAILRKRRSERDDDEKELEPRPAPDSDAVRLLGAGIVPLTVCYGVFIVSHGVPTPGGGFQGGVLLATAPVLVLLCARAEQFLHIAPRGLVKLAESAGIAGYPILGFAGFVAGKAFLENVMPMGKPANAYSGGIIWFLNVVVGCAVAAGFVELLHSFVEEVLRRETQ